MTVVHHPKRVDQFCTLVARWILSDGSLVTRTRYYLKFCNNYLPEIFWFFSLWLHIDTD